MMIDNALANLEVHRSSRSGDTGKRGAEHRGYFKLSFTHHRRNRSR